MNMYLRLCEINFCENDNMQISFLVVSVLQVAGDYSPSQIILACQTYVEKKVLLMKAMGHLVSVFRHWTGYNKIGALSVSVTKL